MALGTIVLLGAACSGPAAGSWLETEKVRGLYGGGGDRFSAALRESGYNTIFCYWNSKDAEALLPAIESGGKQGLRVFSATHFWHYPIQLKRTRRMATAAGEVLENSICPLDRWLWDQCGAKRHAPLARLSLNYPALAGVAFDVELYGKTSWDRPCYCIDCLTEYAASKSLVPPPAPGAAWLEEKGLRDAFLRWQEDELAAIVSKIRDDLHAINPNLLFAVLPYGNNRYLRALARGLGREGLPVILMAEYTYFTGFGSSILNEVRALREDGIHAVLATGLEMAVYPPHRMAAQAYNGAVRAGGYWSYVTGPYQRDAYVTGGWHATPAEWRAWMKYANDEIDRKLADADRPVPVPLRIDFEPPPTKEPYSVTPPKFGAPRVAYCPKSMTAPDIDGVIGKEEWSDAEIANGFYKFGDGSTPAAWQTAVYLKRDEQNLYVAIQCREPDIRSGGKVEPPVEDAESVKKTFSGNVVELFICPEADSDNYYHFSVNADAHRYDDRFLGTAVDGKWNGTWTGRVAFRQQAWTVEMKIPFADLGVDPPLKGQAWRINFYRSRGLPFLSGGPLQTGPAPWSHGVEMSTWSPADPVTWFHQPWNFHHLLFK